MPARRYCLPAGRIFRYYTGVYRSAI
jgi:hypothetical protein